ncbi:MAG: hypothetical protein ACXAHE_14795 [Roseburia sp. 1XD42-69]
MEMCYDGTLVMPSSYAVMSEDEMTYVDGGSTILPMDRRYLNKNLCKTSAAMLIARKRVKGMSVLAITQEIFAHAVMYYMSSAAISAGIDIGVIREVKRRAGKINIDDGGDKWYRKGIYTLIWNRF